MPVGEMRAGDEPGDAEVWRGLIARAGLFGPNASGLVDRMATVEPPSLGGDRPLLIVDSDIGGDPDDAVALAVAARTCPELALVVTSDERGRDRARFARAFLDGLGRQDVGVVAGRDLGNTRYFCVDGLVDLTGPVDSDVLGAVERVCRRADGGRIRWVGIGALSNLADVLATRPDLAGVLEITQMGGALNYRHPDLAEHNIRLDVDAARTALTAGARISLVTADVTFQPDEMAITADGPVYAYLDGVDEGWARLLRAHLDRWYATFYPATLQHDALTLSAALRLPFVDFAMRRIRLDVIGRMTVNPAGDETFLSVRADYEAFRGWLRRGLGMPAPVTGAGQRPG